MAPKARVNPTVNSQSLIFKKTYALIIVEKMRDKSNKYRLPRRRF